MFVEQAVFTSATTRAMRGYHLVGRSSGIDEGLAQALAQWSPSHDSLAEDRLDANSLNFLPARDNALALSRTVFGGPEYSGRGGLQVVTVILVLQRDQLAGYDNDPLALARTALALGDLRLPETIPQHLPPVELPEQSWLGLPDRPPTNPHEETLLDEVRAVLEQGDRAAVIGVSDPLSFLEELLADRPREGRLDLSFTTGLKPSLRRPFRLHFLPSADEALRMQLSDQGVIPVGSETRTVQ